jgi:hypothetical protein
VRLVHLADLHLGFRQYHRLTPDGINQREADVALAFQRAVDRVIELRPDVVLIAGDVFHSVRPMNAAIIDAFVELQRLRGALPDAPVIMIAGNHDRPRATETGCILKLFSRIGVHVVADGPERLGFPALGLSVLAVPDLPLGVDLPPLTRDPDARHNVLLMHLEVEGAIPPRLAGVERAAVPVSRSAIDPPSWAYVALGHYHVHHEVAPNAYYAGSLEYASPNVWGEVIEERATGVPGKGFIEYDLDAKVHRFHPIEGVHRLVDLPAIAARGMSPAELDTAIRERVTGYPGGIDDRIVRIVVRDVPRHVVRELDQRMLREYKRRALHFHLDARKPDGLRPGMPVGGVSGRRLTLKEMVEGYLARRPLDADLDRAALVSLGVEYLAEADAASEQMWGPAGGDVGLGGAE